MADAAEEALVFTVGESPLNNLIIWPSRFVNGNRVDTPRGVDIVMRDGILRVQTHRPWT